MSDILEPLEAEFEACAVAWGRISEHLERYGEECPVPPVLVYRWKAALSALAARRREVDLEIGAERLRVELAAAARSTEAWRLHRLENPVEWKPQRFNSTRWGKGVIENRPRVKGGDV